MKTSKAVLTIAEVARIAYEAMRKLHHAQHGVEPLPFEQLDGAADLIERAKQIHETGHVEFEQPLPADQRVAHEVFAAVVRELRAHVKVAK